MPNRGAVFQCGPFELPWTAIFELVVQRLRIVVVQDLHVLARLQGIEAGEDRGVTFTRRDRAQIENVGEGVGKSRSHVKPFEVESAQMHAHRVR